LVLFNRLFPGDIIIDELEVRPVLHLSDPHMLQIRLLWLAAVFGHVEATLSASGGVQTTADVIKAVMAGASSVQMTSVLLKHGPEHMAKIHRELSEWMEEHEYESIRQMHGSMSRKHCPDPDAYERANYMRTLQSWRPAAR
jgi:dihydroorotate dehydrogenase (fumarate)